MATITESIDVRVPVRVAYNQWTQFEDFPRFMDGVRSVDQIDAAHLRWVADVGGKQEAWTAEITEQRPDELIAWRTIDGYGNAGAVAFQPLGEDETRVTVQMQHDADGMLEQLGSAVGLDGRRVQGDLERFKDLVESRRVESGAWRGEIEGGRRLR
jgi:uncharacterized membrane protein